MRLSLRLFPSVLLGVTAVARADVMYNLALTSTQGDPGGTGSFTINTPPPAIGMATYVVTNAPPINGPGTPGDYLLAFNASLPYQGASVALQNIYSPDYPYVHFTNGVVSAFYGFNVQGGQISYGSYSFGVGATSYSYSYFQYSGASFPTIFSDSGSVTATPAAVAATPEPSSLALVATGLLGCATAVRRRLLSS